MYVILGAIAGAFFFGIGGAMASSGPHGDEGDIGPGCYIVPLAIVGAVVGGVIGAIAGSVA
jgi:hypothetical protein